MGIRARVKTKTAVPARSMPMPLPMPIGKFSGVARRRLVVAAIGSIATARHDSWRDKAGVLNLLLLGHCCELVRNETDRGIVCSAGRMSQQDGWLKMAEVRGEAVAAASMPSITLLLAITAAASAGAVCVLRLVLCATDPGTDRTRTGTAAPSNEVRSRLRERGRRWCARCARLDWDWCPSDAASPVMEVPSSLSSLSSLE
jgi:hypothetical protein